MLSLGGLELGHRGGIGTALSDVRRLRFRIGVVIRVVARIGAPHQGEGEQQTNGSESGVETRPSLLARGASSRLARRSAGLSGRSRRSLGDGGTRPLDPGSLWRRIRGAETFAV